MVSIGASILLVASGYFWLAPPGAVCQPEDAHVVETAEKLQEYYHVAGRFPSQDAFRSSENHNAAEEEFLND